MGSLAQTRWMRSLSAAPAERSGPVDGPAATAGRLRSAPSPGRIAALLAAVWIFAAAVHLVRLDVLTLLAVGYGTGGLLRVGGTVVDRLMVTAGLLVGTAIAAGLVFSVWPFGLNPVAIGGSALTLLVALSLWSGRRPRWPRRVLGSDLLLLAATGVGAFVAYGPARLGDSTHQLAFAALTGDRLRHFSLFDTIHRIGGYPFILQSQAKPVIDPEMITAYPSGGHYLYALLDIFLTSRTDPGSPTRELLRYNLYTCAGYGFLVLCVAWGARWVAGPSMAGWRRSFLVTGVAAFLCTGVMTTAIWCGWDPQVLGMGLLALLAACAARPPASGRAFVLLAGALTVAVFMTYELFAPYAVIIVAVSAVVYRRRWLPHWRFAVATAVLAVPAALSEIIAAEASGFNTNKTALLRGFTVAMSKGSLVIIAVLAVAGFAAHRARRRPSAVAALGATALCGAVVLAFWSYQHATIGTTTYYYEKAVEAWVVIALVGVGTAGHLLRRPALPARGLEGAAVGLCAALVAVLATDSWGFGQTAFDYSGMRPGTFTTWAQVWTNGHYVYPTDEQAIYSLKAHGVLGKRRPTLVIWDDYAEGNVNLSLALAVLNHDDGVIAAQVYGLIGTTGLSTAGESGPWTAQQTASLGTLEGLIASSPVSLTVVVSSPPLAGRLNQWSAAHPKAGLKVLLYADLPHEMSPA